MLRKISTKSIISNPHINIIEDDVKDKSGNISSYILFDKKNLEGVTVIVINKDNKFLMCKDYSYPQQKKLIQFCEGAIEQNEKPLEAAKREMREELGAIARKINKIGEFLAMPRRSSARMHVFLAEDIEIGCQQLEDSESINLASYSKNEIINLIKNGKIVQNNTLSALMIYEAIHH